MDNTNEMTMPISDLTIPCTITLTGQTAFNIRNSVGYWICRFGAWVMGVDAKIEVGIKAEEG